MNELRPLAAWLAGLSEIAGMVALWRSLSGKPFSNAPALLDLERRIGQNLMEVV